MVLKGVECDLQKLNGQIEELSLIAREQDGEQIKMKLKNIVPEYSIDYKTLKTASTRKD